MNKRLLATAAALILSTSATGAAHAAQYLLTVDGCTGGCLGSNSSIGVVTVNQVAGALDFNVTLTNGALFNVNDNSEHHAFVFDLNGGVASLAGLTFGSFTTVNASNLTVATTDFARDTGTAFSDSPFGQKAWPYAIDYVGTAKQGKDESNFSFVLTDSLHNLTLSMLGAAGLYNGQSIEFAADVYSNKKTGNVGAIYHTASLATPEPSTWAMMFMGLFGVGSLLRRKTKAAAEA